MSSRETGLFDLSRSPIHISTPAAGQSSSFPINNFGFNGPAFETYMATHCTDVDPGRLIMIESSPVDWGAWECHQLGDEIVVILEGEAEFIQQIDGEERRFTVRPGDTVINPAGVWHTANVTKPLRAI